MGRPPGVAVVTGALSGIGAAVSRRLAADGASVVAVARRADRLEALAAERPGIVAHVADVTDRTAVEALAGRVAAEFGQCDVPINNPGVGGGGFTERTVPRRYRLLVAQRHLAPPVFWRIAARTDRARGHRTDP